MWLLTHLRNRFSKLRQFWFLCTWEQYRPEELRPNWQGPPTRRGKTCCHFHFLGQHLRMGAIHLEFRSHLNFCRHRYFRCQQSCCYRQFFHSHQSCCCRRSFRFHQSDCCRRFSRFHQSDCCHRSFRFRHRRFCCHRRCYRCQILYYRPWCCCRSSCLWDEQSQNQISGDLLNLGTRFCFQKSKY